jgi:hypothetical protein
MGYDKTVLYQNAPTFPENAERVGEAYLVKFSGKEGRMTMTYCKIKKETP